MANVYKSVRSCSYRWRVGRLRIFSNCGRRLTRQNCCHPQRPCRICPKYMYRMTWNQSMRLAKVEVALNYDKNFHTPHRLRGSIAEFTNRKGTIVRGNHAEHT